MPTRNGRLVTTHTSPTTQLFEAVAHEEEDAAAVERLLKKGAWPDEHRDKYGDTALMEASRWGHVRSVQLLLAADADVNASCPRGFTALMKATGFGYVAVLGQLLAAPGVDVNARSNGYHNGETAVMKAAAYGQLGCLRALVGANADPLLCDHVAARATAGPWAGKDTRDLARDPPHNWDAKNIAEMVEFLEALAEGWVEVPQEVSDDNPSGVPHYWNESTNEVRWEKPARQRVGTNGKANSHTA